MPRKEKAPKEPKPKKEKKPKEPKPKKEKKPKEPKAPKPKKEKKPKKKKGQVEGGEAAEAGTEGDEGEEGAEGGKKKGGGKKKLLLIALPVVVLGGVGAALFLTGVIGGGGGDPPPEETEIVEEEPEETETPAKEDGGEGTGGALIDQLEIPELPEPPKPTPQPNMTTSEIGTFIENLSPETLGLEGEDMSGYEVFPSEGVSYIRDPDTGQNLTCSRIQIFSKGAVSGTNDIAGVYLLTRGGARRLFRLDAENNLWTELSLY